MAKLTQEEKDAIRDAGVTQWWKDWFTEDYSWDGLAEKPWRGWLFVESRQAYNVYTKNHGLPSGCPNKVCRVIPADKVGELQEGTKIRNATLQDYWRDQEDALEGQEGSEKQYTITHLPPHYENGLPSWKTQADHENWQILSDVIAERVSCGARTEAEIKYGKENVTGSDKRAQFCGCNLPSLPGHNPSTDRAAKDQDDIGLHITLYRAAILQTQNFMNATFGSATNFTHTLFSGGDVHFIRAQFSGGSASFGNARFSGGAVYFGDAQFSCGDAFFEQAQFSGGEVSFRGTKFSGGDTSFKEAQFSGGKAYFGDAQFFGGDTSFGHTKFSGGDAIFLFAHFSGTTTSFGNTQFMHRCDFQGAIFETIVTFTDAVFPSAKGSQSAFLAAQFLGAAEFLQEKIIDQNGKPLPDEQLYFPFNAFDHANIKDQLILTERGEDDAQAEFDRALASVEAACKADEIDQREDRYVALERGCTTLKRAMEDISDKTRAQRYFKFELMARQRRPSTPWIVRQMTRAYGLAAGYGGSVWRPLIALSVLWTFCALIYGINAQCLGVTPTEGFARLWGPMDLSAANIFRPLLIWSKAILPNDATWLDLYQEALSPGGWLTIKLLATLQSFASLTLLFLFGLATKRKFQIG